MASGTRTSTPDGKFIARYMPPLQDALALGLRAGDKDKLTDDLLFRCPEVRLFRRPTIAAVGSGWKEAVAWKRWWKNSALNKAKGSESDEADPATGLELDEQDLAYPISVCFEGHATITCSTFPRWVRMEKLTFLCISGNKLTQVPEGIAVCKFLRVLIADANQIRSVGNSILGRLGNLRILSLKKNKISNLKHTIDELQTNYQLKHLCLEENPCMEGAESRMFLINSMPALDTFNFAVISQNDKVEVHHAYFMADMCRKGQSGLLDTSRPASPKLKETAEREEAEKADVPHCQGPDFSTSNRTAVTASRYRLTGDAAKLAGSSQGHSVKEPVQPHSTSHTFPLPTTSPLYWMKPVKPPEEPFFPGKGVWWL